MCSVLAYLIYFKILSTTGPGNLLLCTILISPSAIILNAIFINEMIKIDEFVGMLIIIFGLLDSMDGNLARLNKSKTLHGQTLDTIGADLFYILIPFSISFYFY